VEQPTQAVAVAEETEAMPHLVLVALELLLFVIYPHKH
jgi:hypothetical protein